MFSHIAVPFPLLGHSEICISRAFCHHRWVITWLNYVDVLKCEGRWYGLILALSFTLRSDTSCFSLPPPPPNACCAPPYKTETWILMLPSTLCAISICWQKFMRVQCYFCWSSCRILPHLKSKGNKWCFFPPCFLHFSCFLSLLLVAAVVWKIKQSCWASRRREVGQNDRITAFLLRPVSFCVCFLHSFS